MNNTSLKKQQGIATLFIAIILLIMITMATVLTANVGIMERKISTNDIRASQALLSAQAGIDLALANFSKYGLANPTAPYIIAGNFLKTNGDQAISYNDGNTSKITGYYNISIDTTAPGYPDTITVVAEGLSDDKSASTTIRQEIIFASPMRGLVNDDNFILNKSVLIVDGSADINSSLINNIDSATNTGTLLKAWVKSTISNTTANPASNVFANSAELTNNGIPPMNHVFLDTMRAADDRGLKHISKRTKCPTPCTNPAALSNQAQSTMHYLEGNINLNNLTIGSSTYPSILMVDLNNGGSLSLTNTTINGLLLVKGSWDNNNNPATINGAVVVENGNLLQAGNLTISYDQTVYDNLKNVGIYTRSPGSWSDIN